MTNHTIHLHSIPFAMVRDGQKTIESRLNDEKRRTFAVGDKLTFISREDESEISATIIALHVYKTFAELFAEHEPAAFGGTSQEELTENIRQFYSSEDEQHWGVVGIEFTLD